MNKGKINQLTVLGRLADKVGDERFNEFRSHYFSIPLPTVYLQMVYNYNYQDLFEKSYIPWLIEECKTALRKPIQRRKRQRMFKKMTQQFTKNQKIYIKKWGEDHIFVNRDKVLERKNALNDELLRQQLRARKGNEPITKNANTWRENKVNSRLKYEFGFDTTILDKHPRTVWRNRVSVLEQIENRQVKEVKHDKDPFGLKERARLKRIANKLYDKYAKFKDPNAEYVQYQVDTIVHARPSVKNKKPKPVLEGVGTLKEDYKVDIRRKYYDDDEELVEQYIRLFDGNLIKARYEFLKDYQGIIPAKLENIWKYRINEDDLKDNKTEWNMLPYNNIVGIKLRESGNDSVRAAKVLLELYKGNPPEPIKELFYVLTDGKRSLEDFKK